MLDWEQKRLEKASEVPIESLPEDAIVYVGSGEYMTLDDFLSQKEEYEGQGIHEEAFVCTASKFKIDINEVIARIEENDHPTDEMDIESHLVDLDELQSFVERWNQKQTYGTWHQDLNRKVRVPK